MPSYINSDDFNTYLNYQNPVTTGESFVITATFQANNTAGNIVREWLISRFGLDDTIWNRLTGINADVNSDWYQLRFPYPDETGINTLTNTNHRFSLRLASNSFRMNANNGTGFTALTIPSMPSINGANHWFGVLNDFSITMCSFFDTSLASPRYFLWAGWVKNPAWAGSNYPLNFCVLVGGSSGGAMTFQSFHANVANNSANATLVQNGGVAVPSINCASATPGADSIQVMFRRTAGSNIYAGDAWNLIQVPGTAEYGKVYKNLGSDPDGGGNNAWMPCAPWGSRKLAMRIWTEGFV